MATPPNTDSVFHPNLYLSPDQEDLLRAALLSNTPKQHSTDKSLSRPGQSPESSTARSSNGFAQKGMTMSHPIYASPMQQSTSFPDLDGVLTESSFLDGDLDSGFEFDDSNDDQMFEPLQGRSSSGDGEGDIHDKRKSIDGEDDDGGGGKRREGDDKTSKKPGRKPLTSEPTSKRKAQNRAAQRAFRERKERHLKDLETKVEDLEKASESANHENGLLRAQVERLQTELKEYRKKLSANGSSLSRSPGYGNRSQPDLTDRERFSGENAFRFDFPRFGGASSFDGIEASAPTDINRSRMTEPTLASGATSFKIPGVLQRSNTTSMSPKSQPQRGSSSGASPDGSAMSLSSPRTQAPITNENGIHNIRMEELSGFFSPAILQNVSRNSSFDYLSYGNSKGTERQNSGNGADKRHGSLPTPQSNGGSNRSVSESPSASSLSQHGPGSSAGTSPEPSYQSPTNGKIGDTALNTINEEHGNQESSEGQRSFYDSVNMASRSSGNPDNTSVTLANDVSDPSAVRAPYSDVNGIDWLAQQNGGQFDPVLFGDYRDNSLDYSGFFDDALEWPDFGSPYNVNDLSSPAAKSTLFNQIDDKVDINSTVPDEQKSRYLSCTQVWDKFKNDPRYLNPDINIDDLCSQLKEKARCSGSGAVIRESDVESVLGYSPKVAEGQGL